MAQHTTNRQQHTSLWLDSRLQPSSQIHSRPSWEPITLCTDYNTNSVCNHCLETWHVQWRQETTKDRKQQGNSEARQELCATQSRDMQQQVLQQSSLRKSLSSTRNDQQQKVITINLKEAIRNHQQPQQDHQVWPTWNHFSLATTRAASVCMHGDVWTHKMRKPGK